MIHKTVQKQTCSTVHRKLCTVKRGPFGMQSRGATHICLFQCWKKYGDVDDFFMENLVFLMLWVVNQWKQLLKE